MAWIKEEYDCGNCKMCRKKWASRYGQKREVYIPKNKTSETQQRVNDKNAMFRYSVLANTNFKQGDYFVTYTFKKGALPGDYKELKKLFEKYRRKVRDTYKKKGLDFKYLYVFEYEGVRPHFHILFNNDGMNFADLPKWEYGGVHIELLDDREYHTVGEYFVKQTYDVDDKKSAKKGDIGSSRNNLIRPEAEITILDGSSWDDRPEVDEGYELDEESLDNGMIIVVDKKLEFPYQQYRLIRQKC